MSQIVSRKVFQREDPVLFTAVLMHDIGKINPRPVRQQVVPEDFRACETSGLLFTEGGGAGHRHKPCRTWRPDSQEVELSGTICNVIAYHHNPEQDGRPGQAAPWIAHLADHICMMLGIGGLGRPGLPGLREVISMFSLKQKDIEQFMMHPEPGTGKGAEKKYLTLYKGIVPCHSYFLIVDDSNSMRAVIKKIVSISGFKMDPVLRGGKRQGSPGRASKNWWMQSSPTSTCRNERAGTSGPPAGGRTAPEIPVIVISTEGSQERIEAVMVKGAKSFIKKPFLPEEIRRQLYDMLGVKHEGGYSEDQGPSDDCDF